LGSLMGSMLAWLDGMISGILGQQCNVLGSMMGNRMSWTACCAARRCWAVYSVGRLIGQLHG
jgi:hypothetical protein